MLVRGTLALTHMYSVKVGQDGFCVLSEVFYALRMPAGTVMRMAQPTQQALYSHEIADLQADMSAKEESDQVHGHMDQN